MIFDLLRTCCIHILYINVLHLIWCLGCLLQVVFINVKATILVMEWICSTKYELLLHVCKSVIELHWNASILLYKSQQQLAGRQVHLPWILHLVTENFEMDCINTQPGSTNGDKPKWDVIETTLSTMYGILLVSIYAAFQYTELVKFPSFNHWLEINGFFIYLYVISIVYFLYLLIFVLRGTNKNGNSDGPIKVVENEEVGYNWMMLLRI